MVNRQARARFALEVLAEFHLAEVVRFFFSIVREQTRDVRILIRAFSRRWRNFLGAVYRPDPRDDTDSMNRVREPADIELK